MQVLSVVGALVAAGAALAADTGPDRQIQAKAATQEVHSATSGGPMVCTCTRGDSGLRLSPPGTDAEIDRLRTQGG